MGTHRSRHNKGRKRRFKYCRRDDSAVNIAKAQTGRPPIECAKLTVLEEQFAAGRSITDAAEIAGVCRNTGGTYFSKLGFLRPPPIERTSNHRIGRPPISQTKVAELRRFFNEGYSKGSSALMAGLGRNTASKYLIGIDHIPLLKSNINYPYIIKPRDEHGDLLAVNALIPKGIPDHMRADMCQEIMLAVYEGRVTLDDLRARNGTESYYIRKFYRDNYEDGGRGLSFNDTDEDWDSDRVASSIAAKEWHQEQFLDRVGYDRLKTFTPPTQIEDVFEGQVRRKWIAMQEDALISGDMRDMLSLGDVAEFMEAA